MQNEKKRTSKKKKAHEEGIEEKTSRFERILSEAIELPSHIAIMRGLWKRKKQRRSSSKRPR